MEDGEIVDDTSQKYNLEEEEPKKVVKQGKAVDLLFSGLKSSKITY